MIELSTVYKLRPDVRFRVVDGEAVVVQQQDARVMSLNETGTAILSELDGQRTLGEILAQMADQYEVSAETLRADALRYLDELIAAHVIDAVTPER